MKKYDPNDTAGNILRMWVQDPAASSDDPDQSAKDAAHQCSFLALIVAAHRMIQLACDFSDEGNELEISQIKESLENLVSCYSEMV